LLCLSQRSLEQAYGVCPPVTNVPSELPATRGQRVSVAIPPETNHAINTHA